MTLLPALLAGLIRSAVLLIVTGIYLLGVERSETTDALGAGLIAFLILVTITFVWSIVDGARRGFAAGALVWLVVAVLAGIGIPVVVALIADTGVAAEIRDGAIFFGLLLLVPALLGLVLGALFRRVRGGGVSAGR